MRILVSKANLNLVARRDLSMFSRVLFLFWGMALRAANCRNL